MVKRKSDDPISVLKELGKLIDDYRLVVDGIQSHRDHYCCLCSKYNEETIDQMEMLVRKALGE